MTNFYNKLDTGNDINVLVYGASSATGMSSTGRNMNYELFGSDGKATVRSNAETSGIKAPTFFEQATAELVRKYGNNNNINYYNIAMGGQNAAWGDAHLQERIGYMNDYYGKTIIPDIIYVKFAGNDVTTPVNSFKTSIENIVSQFKELYPNANIVLMSGKINNEKTYIYGDNRDNQLAQEAALEEIANSTENCIVAKVTSVYKEIVESKDYEDYLSNNINHANDFGVTVTAQIIVASAEISDNNGAIVTAHNQAAALRTPEKSKTGKMGLRIYNEIDRDWIDNQEEIVEFGSIVNLKANLVGKELNLSTAGVKGIAYNEASQPTMKLWGYSDGEYYFTSYLSGIPTQYYGYDYSIRAYAIDKNGNKYYGDVINVSVFAVANAIDINNSVSGTQTQDDIDAFYSFVNEERKDDYFAWCQERELTVGSLYNAKYSV